MQGIPVKFHHAHRFASDYRIASLIESGEILLQNQLGVPNDQQAMNIGVFPSTDLSNQLFKQLWIDVCGTRARCLPIGRDDRLRSVRSKARDYCETQCGSVCNELTTVHKGY